MFKFASGVERCIINTTKDGHQVGYARFSTLQEAQQAVAYLNGYSLDEDFPYPIKCFMSSTQLLDLPTGQKRPADAEWGQAPAKVAKGNGKGLWLKGGKGMEYGKGWGSKGWGKDDWQGAGWEGGKGWESGSMGMTHGKGMYGGKAMSAKGMDGKGVGGGPVSETGLGKEMQSGGAVGTGRGGPAKVKFLHTTSVYVGGIPHDWSEEALRGLFEPFGAITHLQLTRKNNPMGNIGFVHFGSKEEAESAIVSMNGYPLDGTKHLVVRFNTSPVASEHTTPSADK